MGLLVPKRRPDPLGLDSGYNPVAQDYLQSTDLSPLGGPAPMPAPAPPGPLQPPGPPGPGEPLPPAPPPPMPAAAPMAPPGPSPLLQPRPVPSPVPAAPAVPAPQLGARPPQSVLAPPQLVPQQAPAQLPQQGPSEQNLRLANLLSGIFAPRAIEQRAARERQIEQAPQLRQHAQQQQFENQRQLQSDAIALRQQAMTEQEHGARLDEASRVAEENRQARDPQSARNQAFRAALQAQDPETWDALPPETRDAMTLKDVETARILSETGKRKADMAKREQDRTERITDQRSLIDYRNANRPQKFGAPAKTRAPGSIGAPGKPSEFPKSMEETPAARDEWNALQKLGSKERPRAEAGFIAKHSKQPATKVEKGGPSGGETDQEWQRREEALHPGFELSDAKKYRETQAQGRGITKLHGDMQLAGRLFQSTEVLKHFLDERSKAGANPMEQSANMHAYNAAVDKANGALAELSKANDRFSKIAQGEEFPSYINPNARTRLEKLEYTFRHASNAIVNEYGWRAKEPGAGGDRVQQFNDHGQVTIPVRTKAGKTGKFAGTAEEARAAGLEPL